MLIYDRIVNFELAQWTGVQEKVVNTQLPVQIIIQKNDLSLFSNIFIMMQHKRFSTNAIH